MNYNVIKALDQEETGDLIKYFNYTDGILEANSGVHDNKCLSIDSSDPPCPVQKGMYTKVKLTDESIQITNIDKSSITALVRIQIKPTEQFWTQIEDSQEGDISGFQTGRLTAIEYFVGLKSSTHLFDAYRVYSRNKKTACEQTEALYENAAIRMLKAQEELDYKPGIYTQWEAAYKHEDNVCGCYFNLQEIIKAPNNTIEKEFEVIIPLDDLLPFAAMKMFPNGIFGNLTLEVKMAIQQNFVICQCNQNTIINKISKQINSPVKGNSLVLSIGIDQMKERDYYGVLNSKHENCSFTQIGDTFITSMMSLQKDSNHELGVLTPKNIKSCFTITDGSLRYCRTNINGFNIKDSVMNELIEKYQTKELIIPSQYVDYQAFSQKPLSNGLKCNTTYAMTNVSSLMFLFPRTSNEVTCSRNPLFASLQMQIDNKPYPDKPFSTVEKSHTIYNITNAGLDNLFSPSKEFAYSLECNELDPSFVNNYNPEIQYALPLKDNTSYCFLCSTERLSGYGTFCDGITKDNAHVTLTATLLPFKQLHPYLKNPWTEDINDRCPIMLVCQDCFWRCTVQGGCEYICNNKYFVKEKTGTD
ncbi:hypothetical protein CL6EHI_196730 [Entamoeba histolytica]|uniref:Uncharacterized protein n=6 Tax=Entamoeba histolytica TaxID=5759 RepID=B1N4T9_ENTH1|nr:hypothetical protein EHI_196730 [Entamoeba histolytica HM-1:IMSS]EDS89015.1 hypothetical protein EHI_196730 [Entamoeba histolytica HM-1:IMSS]GAT98875.1 hypothetical protein CL6EHI_196730 [Entamoeba histolytica]|eukprot:XP_001914205.1 hypothetical protein EHI_196730 [Entamoeba histolytica HM-1:IMSS]